MEGQTVAQEKNENGLSKYLKSFIAVMLITVAFLGLFYYSCGEELYSRVSDGSIDGYSATNDTGELLAGNVVSQTFTSDTDIINSVGVMVSNYGRELHSNTTVSLTDNQTGEVLASRTVNSSELGVNQYLMLDFEDRPLENMRKHLLTITVTSDALPGNAPTVLYNVDNKFALIEHVSDQAVMVINGTESNGVLCITLAGRDNVWTGKNYWKIALVAIIFVAVFFWISVVLHRRGHKDPFFSVYEELVRYKFLIKQLVNRDFKVRYKRSVLGVLWSLLNPMMMMLVQYVVFSQMFKFDIENFPLYLLSGTIVFNYFSEGVSQSLTAIVGNASLITKVYMPKYVYPLTRVLSSAINLIISLIPLILVAAITHEEFTKAYLMLPYVIICLIIFTMGFGLFMSSLMVFFRDMQFLWGIMNLMWMYLTPLFYPISVLPDKVQGYLHFNPLIYYVSSVRSIVMDGVTPQPIMFFQCTMIAGLMLLLGGVVFRKTQDSFIFYL